MRPSSEKVAARFLRKATLQRSAPLFREALAKAYEKLSKMYPNNIEDVLKDPSAPYLSLSAIFDVFIYGRDMVMSALHDKQVPKAKVKDFEKGYKALTRNRPKGQMALKWFVKNYKIFVAISDIDKWSDKGETSEENRAFTVGPFTVHNQTTSEPDVSTKILQSAETLMKRSGISSISRVLYGDVYIVGDINRKKAVAAMYFPAKDNIFLLLLKRFAGSHVHALIHEFGHRYWSKVVDADTKRKWLTHHAEVKRGKSDVSLPPVGSVLEGVKGDPKIEKYEGGKIILDNGNYVATQSYLNFLSKRQDQLRFPTPYAASDPEEHFCEAFALFCLGELKSPHKEVFESWFT